MSSSIYTINGRYRIYPSLNQVQDMHTGNTTHLEPRIMAVLEKLSEHVGQLVSREEMICDIWHNYGGGDEGLSQAVSFLRKVFGDRDRKLILTIPKKGYRLTGVISATEPNEPHGRPIAKSPYMRSLLKAALVLYVIGTAVYFIQNGLYRELPESKQKSSFVTRGESSPRSAVVIKTPTVIPESKITARSTHLKKHVAATARVLPATALYHPPVISAETNENSYHLSDTTARVNTALDYQVSTQLTISTVIN